jgi:N6-L-threonylcarbamoyladenine synthase
MRVLGIETSCDETAASVVSADGVLSDVVYTQTVHQAYLGVVPELASRAHAEKLASVVQDALDKAGVEKPDAVAAASGPGLIGAVLVGLSMAKGLALGWGVPFIGVNHLEGHMLSPMLEDPAPEFPFLGLVVSGGHTTLYLAKSLGDYREIASTVDDAAGEAYDKTARVLGLGYPGGPLIDRLAQGGDPLAIPLPRPKVKGSQDWSFSGLKTAVRQRYQKFPGDKPEDLAASFQRAVVEVLLQRVRIAAKETGVTRLALAGGVAANSELRAAAQAMEGIQVFLPPRHRCTDNGAMIAHAGRLRLLAGQRDGPGIGARSGWPLHSLRPPA